MKIIKSRIDILEELYFTEIEKINSQIEAGKDNLAGKHSISIDLDKVLKPEKKYERYNLDHIIDIYESYGWSVKIIEEDGIIDFS